jgi:CubicO group peptidase (beta-lactamase class C family)
MLATTLRRSALHAWSRCALALTLASGCFAPDSEEGDVPTDRNAITAAAGATTKRCAVKLQDHLAPLKVPGAAVGLLKNGKLACTAVAGMANLEEKRPVTADTVFAIASVSKTLTATTVMQLFDEGKFKLDDDVNKYLPFKVSIPSCPTKPVTFRQLLTHTSSIKDGKAYDSSYGKGDSKIALGDYLKGYLTPAGKAYAPKDNFHPGCPGTTYDYSNVGTALLGYVAEHITKTSFDQLSRARTLLPLGMTETSWHLAGLNPAHLAMPYKASGAGFAEEGHNGYPTYPDGMIRTSVPQLARFLGMFMGDGSFGGKRILKASTVAEMKRVQGVTGDDTEGQGLIWYLDDFGTVNDVLGHDGGDPGVSAYMFFDPKDGAGVILVANAEWNEAAASALMVALFAEARKY